MRKILKLIVILVVSLLVMVACSNDNTDTTNESKGDSSNSSTSETDQMESDDSAEDSNQEDIENEDLDLSDVEANDEVPIIALGETGVIKNNLGTYEITPLSFRFEEELSDEDSSRTNFDGRFIIVLIEFHNIGDEILETDSVIESDLFTESGAGVAGYIDYPGIEIFENEIPVDGKIIGEVVFDTFERDYYELSFGAHLPSNVSNEVRWSLHEEDAE